MRENKIRILHVAQAAGGVDCYIRMLLKYLDKEKFENIMVCSQDFRKEDYNRLADHFEQIEMTRAIGVNDLKVIKAVRKLIKKYNPDIVYAHSSKAGAVARVANIGIKNYCIYNPHGWAFNMKCSAKKKAMYTAIEKVAALFCDKIICISDAEEKSALEKKICREEKLQVILNGVDIEAYENGVHGTVTRRDLDIPKDAFVVGMVGRICPQKAPDIFVRMANQVRNKVPNAHFIIVGNGNQEAEIRKYAEKNGFSDSLHITGWVDNPMNYVELFDVACLLSRWEGFGLFPGISAVNDDMIAVKKITRKSVRIMAYIVFPISLGLMVAGDTIVKVLFTEKWLPMLPYVYVTCVETIISVPATIALQPIKAVGRSDLMLKFEIIKKVFFIVSTIVAMNFGVFAIALTVPANTLLDLIINANINKKLINYSFFEELSDCLAALILSLIMAVVVAFIGKIEFNIYIKVVIQIMVGGLCYAGLSYLTRNKEFSYILNVGMKHFKKA